MTMTIFGFVATAWFVLIFSLLRNKRVMPAIWVTIGFVCCVPFLFKGAVFCGTGLERYLQSCIASRLGLPSMVGKGRPGHWVTGCGCCADCTTKYFEYDDIPGITYTKMPTPWECSCSKHECGCSCEHRPCDRSCPGCRFSPPDSCTTKR